MPVETDKEAFLDSSVLIDLVFRRGGARNSAEEALLGVGSRSSSRYVQFEIARGYLRYLLILYNKSLEVDSYSQLMEYARSGQQIFKRYQREAMLGALVDHQAWLEQTDQVRSSREALVVFRAWLRFHIRRGWPQLARTVSLINLLGCRADLPGPALRPDDRYDQTLPLDECGVPDRCGLTDYLLSNREDFEMLQKVLSQQEVQEAEIQRRTAALSRLLARNSDAPFERRDCYACGDAIICHEAPSASTVISKNGKHFEPLCTALGKSFKGYK